MLNFEEKTLRAQYYNNVYTRIGQTDLFCKPENLVKYQTKLIKPPKGGTRKSAEKRTFPSHSQALESTAAYVKSYLQSNSLPFVGGLEGYILNTAPTTWPDGPDCIATIEEE